MEIPRKGRDFASLSLPVCNSWIQSSKLFIISSASLIVPLNVCCSSWKYEKKAISFYYSIVEIEYFCVKALTRLASTSSAYKTSFISCDWTLLVFLKRLYLSFSFAPHDLTCESKQTQWGSGKRSYDTHTHISLKGRELGSFLYCLCAKLTNVLT